MKTRMVWKVRVITKSFLADFGQNIKNIVGGKLKAYEKMIDQAIGEAYEELLTDYPDVRNVRIQNTEIVEGAAEVIVYGEVDIYGD